MRKIVWLVAWGAVAVWSLFVWSAFALFDVVAGVVRSEGGGHVPGFPVDPGSVAWIVDIVRGVGGPAFLVVWVLVSLIVLLTARVATALFRAKPQTVAAAPDGRGVPVNSSRANGLGVIADIAREARRRHGADR